MDMQTVGTDEESLRSFLEMTASFLRTHPEMRREGWAFNSVDEYVLAKGQFYVPAPKPKGIRFGKVKECYANATRLVMDDPDLCYCEGYATGVIPCPHAWVVDKDGRVIDNTWRKPGTAYLGVCYPRDDYLRWMVKTGYYGVLGGDFAGAGRVLKLGSLEAALADMEAGE